MRFAPWLNLAAFFLGLLVAFPLQAECEELSGTWHVLVHYQDSTSPHPEQWNWEDRIWIFRGEGDRLGWRDYPIVIFKDRSGRFERDRSGFRRIIHAWEPNAKQRKQIRRGLKVNTRGARHKRLEGSDAVGWQTVSSGGAPSASVITFSSDWSITWKEGLPTFRWSDSLGSGQSVNLEGMTEFSATERGEDFFSGTYVRDGELRGKFRMIRAGDVFPLED